MNLEKIEEMERDLRRKLDSNLKSRRENRERISKATESDLKMYEKVEEAIRTLEDYSKYGPNNPDEILSWHRGVTEEDLGEIGSYISSLAVGVRRNNSRFGIKGKKRIERLKNVLDLAEKFYKASPKGDKKIPGQFDFERAAKDAEKKVLKEISREGLSVVEKDIKEAKKDKRKEHYEDAIKTIREVFDLIKGAHYKSGVLSGEELDEIKSKIGGSKRFYNVIESIYNVANNSNDSNFLRDVYLMIKDYKRIVKTAEEQRSEKLRGLEQRVGSALAIIGVAGSIFFLSPSLTGNVILNMSRNALNWIGIGSFFLIVLGVLLLIYSKNKKKNKKSKTKKKGKSKK